MTKRAKVKTAPMHVGRAPNVIVPRARRHAGPLPGWPQGGWFSEPVRAWPGLCNYVPQFTPDDRSETAKRNSLAARAKCLADGVGWGNGTLTMAGTPKHDAPEWMTG